ncbi:MAG: carbon starvation protein A [Candidatus Margulisiibacteriota bacterium]|jgi:carbon starvation protein
MKKKFKIILWILIAFLAAIALAIIFRAAHTGEKINALWLIIATACIFTIAYRFYGYFIAAKVLGVDAARETPALTYKDGINYCGTNRWVLLGHHFAAIAGAGPLTGPVLAAQFGYFPGFLWILIGAVLGGAVHDMIVLFASVRNNGLSLVDIAKKHIGPVGWFLTGLAVIFIILLTLSGFGLSIINALYKNPWGLYIVSTTIPIALIMGIYQKIRPDKLVAITIFGIVCILGAVYTGHIVADSPFGFLFNLSKNQLTVAMMCYGFIASILPVWILLCPRDYLSTYVKIGTMFLLAIGVIVIMPKIHMPAITQFAAGGGPVVAGPLFPFLFITIACGAISGYHALISSGTTPKMILSEKDIPMIGFGAMLIEGMVALMALIAATTLIPGDYFAINSNLTVDQLAAIGLPVSKIGELSQMVGSNLMGRTGGAVSLAVGMANIFSGIFGKFVMPYWYNFALMFEAFFILAALDAGTRIARFILQEFFGAVYKPMGKIDWWPGTLLTSLIIVLAWGYLIFSGSISLIWPMFGVANQLLATIGLGIGTTLLIKFKKIKYIWVTLLPMCFMAVTTLTAAIELSNIYWLKIPSALGIQALSLKIDIGLIIFIASVSILTLITMIVTWIKLLRPIKTL